jgi:hypothetical protein
MNIFENKKTLKRIELIEEQLNNLILENKKIRTDMETIKKQQAADYDYCKRLISQNINSEKLDKLITSTGEQIENLNKTYVALLNNVSKKTEANTNSIEEILKSKNTTTVKQPTKVVSKHEIINRVKGNDEKPKIKVAKKPVKSTVVIKNTVRKPATPIKINKPKKKPKK